MPKKIKDEDLSEALDVFETEMNALIQDSKRLDKLNAF